MESSASSIDRKIKVHLYHLALRAERQRRSFAKALDRDRGLDPLAFITGSLRQCRGESWRGWRTVLKAAYGMPLDDDELPFFRKVAQRDPPGRRVRELWLIVGRRGGKDSVA